MRVARLSAVRANLGQLEFQVDASRANELVALVQAPRTEEWLRLAMILEETPARRIRGLRVTPLARNVAASILGQSPAPFRFRSLGTMASLGRTQSVATVMGMRLTGFPAWWIRRTYYLFQMPRWDRRLRLILDWTVALFVKPDVTKVELPYDRVSG